VAANSLVYSPDGKLLAGADSRTIRLWDAADGRELRQLGSIAAPARGPAIAAGTIGTNTLVFSPDGKTLAAYVGAQVRVWDVATGREVADWPAPGTGTPSLAFSPDGKHLAALRGYPRPTITVWDAASGQQVQMILFGEQGGASAICWLAYAPDGRSWAAATVGRPILLVEAATGQVRAEWTVMASPPAAVPGGAVGPVAITAPGGVAFAPDGRAVYAVTHDGVAAWDVAAGREVRRFGSAMSASPLSLSADGKVLAVRAADGVRVYEPATGRPRQRITDPSGLPLNNAFALAPDGATLALIDRSGSLRFWNTATGRERTPSAGHSGPIMQMAFAPDGKTLTSASLEKVCVWDVAEHKQQAALEESQLRPRLQVLSPDGRRLALVGATTSVRVVEVPGGRLVRQLDDVAAGPYGLAFSVDGGTLAISEGKAIKLWDVTSGALRRAVEPGPNAVTQVALAPDGRRLAGAGGFGGVQVWDAETGRPLWEQAVPAGRWAPVFSADGARLAYSGGDGLVRVFDAATGKELALLEGHPGLPPTAAFSPDGAMLATGGSERLVRVWEVASGRLLHTLAGHVGSVDALAYSPDGQLLASGGSDAVVYLWDASRLGPRSEAAAAPEPELADEQLTRLWETLGDTDAAKAYAAMQALMAAPRTAVPGLRARLKPAEGPDPQKLAALLADLDSARFDRRERATRELAALGDAARGALEKLLAGGVSVEARQRAQELMKTINHPVHAPEMLRQLRAVEALERIGTPEAGAVLAELAKGADGARLTREAQASLERLTKQTGKMP
jgi:WD40 repeat protein